MSETVQYVVDLIADMELPGYGADKVGFMAETVEARRPDFIGDWGTNRGSSARIWFETSVAFQLHPRIVTVDLPLELSGLDRDHAGADTCKFLEGVRIQKQKGDGVTVALLDYVQNGCQLPVFFLDGDHLRENVFREIVLIHRIVPHAVMLCHDTCGDSGPAQAIEDYLGRFPGQYVPTALNSQAGMVRLWPQQ